MGPKDGVVYLALSLRNVGNGISILHGWRFSYERAVEDGHPPLSEFRPHTRDLYRPVGEPGFWQGAFRDPADPLGRDAYEPGPFPGRPAGGTAPGPEPGWSAARTPTPRARRTPTPWTRRAPRTRARARRAPRTRARRAVPRTRSSSATCG